MFLSTSLVSFFGIAAFFEDSFTATFSSTFSSVVSFFSAFLGMTKNLYSKTLTDLTHKF